MEICYEGRLRRKKKKGCKKKYLKSYASDGTVWITRWDSFVQT